MRDERAAEAVRDLVDRYRAQCLWFLPTDYSQAPEDVNRGGLHGTRRV